jgi:hypothetical protein
MWKDHRVYELAPFSQAISATPSLSSINQKQEAMQLEKKAKALICSQSQS